MCRVLTYLGTPIPADELLYKPDNSFIKQSYNPKYMSRLLNLAGFGMIAWDKSSSHSDIPFLYKTSLLPFYDENLRHLAVKLNPACLLTHIRGVPYIKEEIVSNQNAHPFIYRGIDLALAHNGSLSDFNKMKPDMFKQMNPIYARQISGTTDSEWIYALLLSHLPEKHTFTLQEVAQGIIETFSSLIKIRQKNHIAITSPVNLFITNGEFLIATRCTLDFGWQPDNELYNEHYAYHSLWYTYGENYGLYEGEYKMKESNKKSCIIIASEPLTEDTTTWIELPEYTMLMAWRENDQIKIVSQDIIL